MNNIKEIIESLSPLERKILPYLSLSIKDIEKKSSLDEVSVLRALKFLENKKALKLIITKKTYIELGVNGVYYKKNHLPERKLLTIVESHPHVLLESAHQRSQLSENEFRAAFGALKR